MPVDFMAKLKLDERELASRRAFFEITDEDLSRLRALRPLAERHSQDFVEKLYELILGHAESRSFFPDESTILHVKKMQRQYFLGLFDGRCDLAYVEDRLRVGAAHERVGLSPKWYIGAYGRYLRLLFDQFFEELAPAEAQGAYRGVSKLVMFDMSLAIDTYIAANLDTVARHQAAIRELSTPVIRVHRGVLTVRTDPGQYFRRPHQVVFQHRPRGQRQPGLQLVREPAGDAVRLQRLVRGPDDVGQHARMLTLQSERSRELKQTGGKVHVDGVLSEMLSRPQSWPCTATTAQRSSSFRRRASCPALA